MGRDRILASTLVVLLSACADPETTFVSGDVELTLDLEHGTFSVAIGGHRYLVNATSAVETGRGTLLEAERHLQPASTLEVAAHEVLAKETADGLEIRFAHPPTSAGRMTTVLTLRPEGEGLWAQLELEASQDRPDLMGLVPIHVGEPDSGLFFKSDPARLSILQNGFEKGMDHYVALLPGDTEYGAGIQEEILENAPAAASNWCALVYDRDAAEGLFTGHLTFERVVPEVVFGFDATGATRDARGVRGYPRFQARSQLVLPQPIAAGEVARSELVWLTRFSGRPHGALDAYALRLRDRFGAPRAFRPMADWNSWYAHRTGIDQAKIESELDAARELLVDYGMNAFTVDAGWEDHWGDWNLDPARFSWSMAELVARIREAGLDPVLWISPFNGAQGSQLLAGHRDWISPVDGLWRILMWPDAEPLDLSRPEVIDHVRDLGRRVADWGFSGVKSDFAYYQLMITGRADPSRTNIETYRQGMRAFREGLGEAPWLLNIHLLGTNAGLVDAIRIGNDTWPCWGDSPGEECEWADTTIGYSAQGVRVGVKTLARRYYLNGVLWTHHPDQVFFRDSLSLEAQRSWGTVVALSGGVLSLGDPIRSLSDVELDTYRRFLPNLGARAVPLDLFDREYPEVWLTDLRERPLGGAVLALYSWGENRDFTVSPPAIVPEGPRRHHVALTDLSLSGPHRAFELWTQSDLGVVSDAIELDVPPRDSRVVILRPVLPRPYLVASNRHVSQGATDLSEPRWDEPARTLSWAQALVQGFAHTTYLDAAGLATTPTVSASDGSSAEIRRIGELWAIDLRSPRTGSVDVRVRFEP